MSYNATLRAAIKAAIHTPADPPITGADLQAQLLSIVDGFDIGALLLGVATPSLTPNTEANGFYFALQSGIYTNFPTINGQTITVDSSEVAIIVRSGNYWSKIHITTYPTIDPTTKHWMIGNEDTGVLAEGTTPHIDQESGNWMIGTYDTRIHAQGAPGKDAYQPFKGTFSSVQDLNAVYPEPNDGDTAYVSVTVDSTTELHVYDVESGAWHDTGTTADSPVFGSGQLLSSVKIDDTHLANPADSALPTAEDVLQLKAKLEGVTASEDKATIGEQISGYINGNGVPTAVSSGGTTTYVVIPLNNANMVRLLGSTNSSIGTNYASYAFWNSATYADSSTVIEAHNWDVKEGDTNYAKEYILDVPNGATHIAVTLTTSTNQPNFYCYLQSGESVGEFIERTEPIVNDCEKAYNNLQFGDNPIGEPISPTNEFSGLIIYGSRGDITQVDSNYPKIYCYPTSSEDRYVYVDLHVEGTSTQVGGVWLIDNVSTIVGGGSIPLTDKLNEPKNTSVGNPKDVDAKFFVPAGRILVVTYSNYNSNSYLNVYETEYNSQAIKDIQNDITDLQGKTADLSELAEDVGQIKEKTDNLVEEYEYTDIYSEAIEVESYLGFIANDTVISSSQQSYWRIIYFRAKEQDWKLKLEVNHNNTNTLSCRIGCTFLVDDPSQIVDGLNVSSSMLEVGIRQPNTSIDEILEIPAGKYVAVSTTTYQPTLNTFAFYEASLTFAFLNDIENLEETKLDEGKINPDYVSIGNPLEMVKETAGYTSIFRTMGVIGGSMSSGAIYPGGSPEYSQIQYIARLCGSEGHNFGRGGISARNWPKSDQFEAANEFKANPMQMYIIQLGNNDSAYNIDHTEYIIGEVTQLNGIDGTGTVPDVVNVGSAGPIEAYPNYANTFCGQMGKILACIRRVSPKAHVFLSTFLRGYGDNQNFAYNQAIRDIFAFLSDSENIPTGDTLKYHLIDYETYGTPYSSYLSGSETIHKGTVASSHLMASGYLLWSYEYCTYIDWIIKNNMSNFNDVSAICKKIVYNLDNVTIDSVSVNGVSLNTNYLPNYVPYQGTLVLHLTAPTSINSVNVYNGYGHAGSSITSSTWDSATQTITISSVENLITITAKGS